jgi:hypothetical protein
LKPPNSPRYATDNEILSVYSNKTIDRIILHTALGAHSLNLQTVLTASKIRLKCRLTQQMLYYKW